MVIGEWDHLDIMVEGEVLARKEGLPSSVQSLSVVISQARILPALLIQ